MLLLGHLGSRGVRSRSSPWATLGAVPCFLLGTLFPLRRFWASLRVLAPALVQASITHEAPPLAQPEGVHRPVKLVLVFKGCLL